MDMPNNNIGEMFEIMTEIELDTGVNGAQQSELYSLAWYKAHYTPSAIYLDVGTFNGNCAIVMASALKHQGLAIPSKVYTVDNYSSETIGLEKSKSNISCFGIDNLVSAHEADAVEFVNSLHDGAIDMVFDDAGHSYADTFARLTAYAPKMNRNSLIVGHDYYPNFPGVIKAVEDFRRVHKSTVSALRGIPGMFWMFFNLEAP